MKIIKRHKDIFYHCQGKCKICMNEGSCILENLIKKYGLDKVKLEVYNE